MADVAPVELSHDAVSRWLKDAHCQPKDIWEAAKQDIVGKAGVLIADDTVLNKSRSDKIELVQWQYSGAEHDIVKGIGMVNLLWLGSDQTVMPADFRIYHPPEDGKTKNDHLREMVVKAKERGVIPEAVVADSWYSSLDNLKCIHDLGWVWVVGLRKNRVVNRGEKLGDLTIPDEGVCVHLRGYGWVTVYRFVAKNGRTDYIGTNMAAPTREQVKRFVKLRWGIEVYHRELKQTAGLEYCQSRSGRAQRNHIGLSVLSWIRKARLRTVHTASMYQQQWEVVRGAIALDFQKQYQYLRT